MNAIHYTVSWSIRLLVALLCKVDSADLRKVPREGPCIIVTNHINFLEVPVLYTLLMPRRLTALVKAETWNNPFMGFLGSLWNGIPIYRGRIDRKAMDAAKQALGRKEMLFIAPEGTRSGDGRLGKGSPGVVLLAAGSGVPVIPIVHFGGELFWRNLRNFRRTGFTIRVGAPFTIDAGERAVTRSARKEIVDEVMQRLAELLPASYRGFYEDLRNTSGYTYLTF